MSLSLRNRLVLFTFALTGLASFTLIAFFLLLYWNDKRLTLLNSELDGVRQSSLMLNELLDLGRSEDLAKLGESRWIAMAVTDACNPDSTTPPAVSRLYEPRLKQDGVDPMDFVNDPRLFLACSAPRSKGPEKTTISLLDLGGPLSFPAATFLLRPPHAPARLLVLSLEGLRGGASRARLLLGEAGTIVWRDRPDSELNALLGKTGMARAVLARTAEALLLAGAKPLFREAGDTGLIAAAPVAGSFVLASITQMPTLIDLSGKEIGDAALLAAAILFASLFLSRALGYFLIRPLLELNRSAERVGSGDFDFRFAVRGGDEFAGVKRSLNLMIEKVAALVGESARKVALESEFHVTRSVQELFFPPTNVKLPLLEMSSFTATATQCGGDWWGYLETKAPDGRPLTILMIGDVTGHGVSSALMTAAVRGGAFVLSRRLESEPFLALEPGRMMELVNRSIFDSGQGKMNMTFFIAVIDPKYKKIVCANAAHVQSYLMHSADTRVGKRIAAIGGKSGITLGESADAHYESETHDWFPGSKLFLYTDGLTDIVVEGKNLFERKAVRRILADRQDDGAERMLSILMEARESVARGIPNVDDITVVICAAVDNAGATDFTIAAGAANA